jgi:hypothetical protein
MVDSLILDDCLKDIACVKDSALRHRSPLEGAGNDGSKELSSKGHFSREASQGVPVNLRNWRLRQIQIDRQESIDAYCAAIVPGACVSAEA